LLRWLKRKSQIAAIAGAREDLLRFVDSLRGQSDVELGAVLVMAAVVRVAMRKAGALPDELLQITGDPQQAVARGGMAQLVLRYQSEKRLAEATGAMVWLHSLRALCFPEVRYLGREMWRQLQRGQAHVIITLQALGFPPLSEVGFESGRIPDDLHPDDPPPGR
jgi:hypothetical protein